MSRKEITELYRRWRELHGNEKPDRVVVKMYWEDEGKDEKRTDTIALKPCDVFFPKDDSNILFYAHGLEGLLQLTEVGNGSDFVVTEVLGFYKAY
jgi:hypothetical protein